MAFRILSIDGGGLRGIIPVLILKHLQTVTGHRRIIDAFEMVAGTSTGGLIAAGLTVADRSTGRPRYAVDDLERIYTERGGEIFPRGGRLRQWWNRQPIANLFSPQFTRAGLDRVLEDLLHAGTGHEPRLLDCCRPVLIASYDLAAEYPLIFNSRSAIDDDRKNARLIDICRATSAGPTYLPPHTFVQWHRNPDTRHEVERVVAVDGGVFMNNPSMAALIEVVKNRQHAYYNRPNLKDEEIFLLSIGTGHMAKDIAHEAPRWGKLRWIGPSIDLLMWGGSQAVDYQVREGLTFAKVADGPKVNYLRLNVRLTDSRYSDMANSSPEALDHWRERVQKDYLNDGRVQDAVSAFLSNAGMLA